MSSARRTHERGEGSSVNRAGLRNRQDAAHHPLHGGTTGNRSLLGLLFELHGLWSRPGAQHAVGPCGQVHAGVWLARGPQRREVRGPKAGHKAYYM